MDESVDALAGLGRAEVSVLVCAVDPGNERAAAHALVYRAASALLTLPTASLHLGHDRQGRPRITRPDVRDALDVLDVSISHSRGISAVALCARARVGVDVEASRPLAAAALARRWLTAEEAEWVSGQPEESRGAAFRLLWTQKEAVGKARGRGLRGGGLKQAVPVRQCRPTAMVGPDFRLTRLPDDPLTAVAACELDGRFTAGLAVAVCGADGSDLDVRVRFLDLREPTGFDHPAAGPGGPLRPPPPGSSRHP